MVQMAEITQKKHYCCIYIEDFLLEYIKTFVTYRFDFFSSYLSKKKSSPGSLHLKSKSLNYKNVKLTKESDTKRNKKSLLNLFLYKIEQLLQQSTTCVVRIIVNIVFNFVPEIVRYQHIFHFVER